MLEDFNEAVPSRPQGNTVLGQPERLFAQAWVVILSRAMLKSGKGFRMDSPNRKPKKGASGWHGERRADKLETGRRTKLERRLLKPAVQA
jgi:hypothetical protein